MKEHILVSTQTSQIVAQSKLNFARTHVRASATFNCLSFSRGRRKVKNTKFLEGQVEESAYTAGLGTNTIQNNQVNYVSGNRSGPPLLYLVNHRVKKISEVFTKKKYFRKLETSLFSHSFLIHFQKKDGCLHFLRLKEERGTLPFFQMKGERRKLPTLFAHLGSKGLLDAVSLTARQFSLATRT